MDRIQPLRFHQCNQGMLGGADFLDRSTIFQKWYWPLFFNFVKMKKTASCRLHAMQLTVSETRLTWVCTANCSWTAKIHRVFLWAQWEMNNQHKSWITSPCVSLKVRTM